MFKKISIITISLILFFNISSRADEGMWLLTLLNKNYDEMKAQGFKLTPEDIYSVNNASLKDAIVIFGGFCTGEIISEKGLILTNHHCGYGRIQEHSTTGHNYLKDGFWAATHEDELPNPGLFVKFLIKMEDVTEEVLKNVNDGMSETERAEEIKKAKQKVEQKSMKDYQSIDNYEIIVQSFFNSNDYYLIVYQIYNDVRYVGSPPSSIGKFGHDTDNWMWPRHTGDFSLFRVYMSPDGKPADYSTKNIPLKPKYSLPISLKGYQKGDFAMVLGFPGRTDRYMTSYAIEEALNITNPNRILIRGLKQDIMMVDMEADEAIYIKYAAKFSRSSNFWKYSIGQSKDLKKLNVLGKKQELEKRFTKWVGEDKSRLAKYSQALPMIENAYKERKDLVHGQQYLSECMLRGMEFIAFAHRANKLYQYLQGNDGVGNKEDLVKKLRAASEKFFKNYNSPTDKKVSIAMLDLYYKNVDAKYYPTFLSNVKKTYDNDFDKYISNIFANSIFVDKEKFDKFLNDPQLETIKNDLAFTASQSVFEKNKELRKQLGEINEKMVKGKRLYLAGLIEMDKSKFFYPDANFTMRLTYGTVGDYSPKDGVIFQHFTTLEGIMEKEDPGNWEFDVHPKLKELYEKKDYGQYGVDGVMPVCFTTNNDITGGNSGSPVINGKGELIGLAFDGNWEAMSGDIAFENDLQKCINVDIRYVLFIMDKFAGAKHLVDEMNIVK